LSQLGPLEEAVAHFASSCSRKLKEQDSCCRAVTVFAYTSRFRTDAPCSAINRTVTLTVPTNDLRELVSVAVGALRSQWDASATFFYKKAGVIVWDICPSGAVQGDLFDTVDRAKQARLAAAIDAINRKNGYNTVKVAVQGTDTSWRMKHEHESGKYTTNIDDVIKMKA
jgi:DNA polymerase V